MKHLLSLAVFTAVSAATMLPLPAAAHTRLSLTANDPQRADGRDRHARAAQYHQPYGYARGARSARDGRYVEPRGFIDRNRDGMDDRRGRRDLDRDGIADRYDRDLDNDGIANNFDRDKDGDGVRNRRDRHPDNRYAY